MENITTGMFRLSFPNLFKARAAFPDQPEKFSIVMLFSKDEDLSAMKQLARAAVEKKWPDLKTRPKNLRNPFRDGDEKSDISGYPGHIFITASSKQKPGVVDRNVQPILSEAEVYAGCYCRAGVTAYAYSRAGNTGVAFGLQNVQFLKDGEPFTGRSKPEEDFEAVEYSDDEASAKADEMFAGDEGEQVSETGDEWLS